MRNMSVRFMRANVVREWTTTAHSVVKNGRSAARRCGSNRRTCYVASIGFHSYKFSGAVKL